MNWAKYKKVYRYAALVGLVFLAYILQSMVFTHIAILGAVPVILPVAVVSIGLSEGGQRGALMGLIGGILCDVSFNQPTVGFTLILTLVGVLTGYLGDRILEKGITSYIVCSVLVLVLSAFVQMFSLLIYRNVPILSLLQTALIQTVYSLLFILPMYYLCWLIRKIQ